jgi:hypothetical protein
VQKTLSKNASALSKNVNAPIGNSSRWSNNVSEQTAQSNERPWRNNGLRLRKLNWLGCDRGSIQRA